MLINNNNEIYFTPTKIHLSHSKFDELYLNTEFDNNNEFTTIHVI